MLKFQFGSQNNYEFLWYSLCAYIIMHLLAVVFIILSIAKYLIFFNYLCYLFTIYKQLHFQGNLYFQRSVRIKETVSDSA